MVAQFAGGDPFLLWNRLNQQNTPSVPNPASTIANGLGGAQQRPVQMGPTAQDTGDPWGMYRANTRPSTPMVDNGGSASHAPTGGAPGAPSNANPRGYKASGWDLSQNQYNYAIPTEFRANQNLYQMGYDPNADTARLPTAAGGETNFNRVYAQMNSLSRENGFGDISAAPPEFQQWAMGIALGRLRTDYQKTGADWNTSGFAGYDRYQQQGGGGNTQPGEVPYGMGKPYLPPNFDPRNSPTFTPKSGEWTSAGGGPYMEDGPGSDWTYDPNPNGATRQNLPTMGSNQTIASHWGDTIGGMFGPGPLVDNGDGTASHGGSPMSAGGYDPATGGRGDRPTVGNTAVPAGGSTAGGGYYNGPGIGGLKNDPTIIYDLIKNGKASDAVQMFRMMMGKNGPARNRIGKYTDGLYGQMMQAFSQLGGLGGTTAGPQQITDFLGAVQSGGLQGLLGGAAQSALGANYEGIDNENIEAALAAATGLQNIFTGTIAGNMNNNYLENLMYDLNGRALNGDTDVTLANILHGSPYERAMQAYARR